MWTRRNADLAAADLISSNTKSPVLFKWNSPRSELRASAPAAPGVEERVVVAEFPGVQHAILVAPISAGELGSGRGWRLDLFQKRNIRGRLGRGHWWWGRQLRSFGSGAGQRGNSYKNGCEQQQFHQPGYRRIGSGTVGLGSQIGLQPGGNALRRAMWAMARRRAPFPGR